MDHHRCLQLCYVSTREGTAGAKTEDVVVVHMPAEGAASLGFHLRAYDLLRTVNDAGRGAST
jgi:hypothetical protein